MGIFDVTATPLIDEVAREFQKRGIKQPAFVDFVKSGMHRERAPQRKDWYFVRMASILYRLHKDGCRGTGSLRTYYGGRKNRGVQKHHSYKAGGKIIRSCLQELERQGFVVKGTAGRKIVGKGEKLLNQKARVIAQNIAREREQQKRARADILHQREQWKKEGEKRKPTQVREEKNRDTEEKGRKQKKRAGIQPGKKGGFQATAKEKTAEADKKNG